MPVDEDPGVFAAFAHAIRRIDKLYLTVHEIGDEFFIATYRVALHAGTRPGPKVHARSEFVGDDADGAASHRRRVLTLSMGVGAR